MGKENKTKQFFQSNLDFARYSLVVRALGQIEGINAIPIEWQ